MVGSPPTSRLPETSGRNQVNARRIMRLPSAIVLGSAVGICAALASANVLRNGFVFDDHIEIERNPWTRWDQVANAFVQLDGSYNPDIHAAYYRPLKLVLYATARSVFGLHPWGFHLLLLMAHVGVSACAFFLARRWLSREAAFAAGLLFAVHPIHSEAVAWNAGFTDVPCALFAMLSLLAALGEHRRRFVVAPALLLAGMLCKEPAVMIVPVVAVGLWQEGRLRQKQTALLGVGYLVAVAIYLGLRLHASPQFTAARNAVTGWQAVATGVALVGRCCAKLVRPTDLNVVHTFPFVSQPTDARLLGGALAIALLVWAAYRGRRTPVIAVGLALLVFPLLPALYVPVLADPLFQERYLYLPSAGAMLVAGWAFERALVRHRFAWAALAALLVLGGAQTARRNGDWKSDLTLWSRALELEPNHPLALESFGVTLVSLERYSEALPILARVVNEQPDRLFARINLAGALQSTGRPEEGLVHARIAAEQRPNSAAALSTLGWILCEHRAWDEAIPVLQRALALDPMLPLAHNSLGIAYASTGEFDRAVVQFEAAADLAPSNPTFARNLRSAIEYRDMRGRVPQMR